MSIGVFSVFYEGLTPEAMAKRIREEGFQCVQLYLPLKELPDRLSGLDEASCRRINQAFANEGISIATIGAFGNVAHPDPAIRKEAVALVHHACRWAEALGTDIVSTMSGSFNPQNEWLDHPHNHTAEAMDAIIPTFRELASVAAEHRLKLCIEPYYYSIADTAGRIRQLVEAAGPNAGIMYDPAAMIGPDRIHQSGKALRDDFRLLFDRFQIVHVHDVAFSQGEPEFLKPGLGKLDWAEFYRLIKACKWEGPIVLENPADLAEQRMQLVAGLSQLPEL